MAVCYKLLIALQRYVRSGRTIELGIRDLAISRMTDILLRSPIVTGVRFSIWSYPFYAFMTLLTIALATEVANVLQR